MVEYTERQQQQLAAAQTIEGLWLDTLILGQANSLHAYLTATTPVEQQARAVKLLRKYHRSYWLESAPPLVEPAEAGLASVAAKMQETLWPWQNMRSMHESVIDELETLVRKGGQVTVR